MSGIAITRFAGETPRVGARLLPQNGAQLASNCKLTSGKLEPWAGPDFITTLGKWAAGDAVRSVHRVNYNGADYWLHWVASELNQNEVVKLFPSPVVADAFERLYYNKGGQLYTTTKALATQGAGTEYPLASYELGVAAPTDTPTVVPPAIVEETQTYAYTYYNDVTLKESTSLSPTGSATGYPLAELAWQISMEGTPAVQVGFETDFPTHRRIYRSDAGTFKRIGEVTVGTLSFSDTSLPFGVAFAAGTSVYSPAAAPTVSPGDNPVEDVLIAYVYTLVSIYGEESAPSPAQTEIVSGQPVGATTPWTVTMASAPSAGNRAALQYRNVYRTFTNTDGSTTFQFVEQLPVAQTVFVDDNANGALGEALASDGWVLPPTDISAFAYFGNGVFAALAGKTLYLSEPFQPHAWPASYARAIGFAGVGLEVVGNSLIVLTDGDPIVLTGTDPAFLSDAKLDINQPCVSAATVINVGPAVAYMSPVGYVYAGLGGSQIMTRPLFSKADWAAINPSTASFAARYDDGLMFFTPSNQYLLTPSEQLSILSSINLTEVTTLYTDPESGEVLFARNGGLYKWDAFTTKLGYLWRSKKFVTPRPINLGCCQIISDAGLPSPGDMVDVPGGRGINESGINGAPVPYLTTDPVLTFRLYAYDPATKAYPLVHTEVITSTEPFTLPSGYKSDSTYFELEGTATVETVYLAETRKDLKGLGE